MANERDPAAFGERRTYLGDGAFVEIDPGGRLLLTTSNGIVDTNKIYLGVTEWTELVEYVKRLKDLKERGSGGTEEA